MSWQSNKYTNNISSSGLSYQIWLNFKLTNWTMVYLQYQSHNYIRMRLSGRIRYCLGRRSDKSDFDFNALADSKFEYIKKYSRRYKSEEKFQHKQILFEQFLYGHSCHIVGTTAYNFSSLGFAKSAMKMVNPRLLILGGICDNQLRYYESLLKIRHFYEHPLYRPQKMICKERISRYIQRRLEQDYGFNWYEDKKQMVSINHEDRRIEPHDELTLAHLASLELDTRIALGKPSDTVVLEDLIMRYSVEQLRGIAERAIQKTRARRSKQKQWQISYTREAIRNYVMSEEPEIFSKELTYQAALLKRYAKLSDKILMTVPGYFVKRIADQVHQIDVKPQQIYRDGLNDPNTQVYSLLQKTLKEQDPQTILQKFALLMLIRQSPIESEFARGVNIFKNMCFGSLFKEMDLDELFGRYQKARQATQTKWFELIHQRINNVHIEPGAHIKYTLAEQFEVLEERVTKSFPYTYQQKNYLSMHEDNEKMSILIQKMRDYLNAEGDKHRIEIFDSFMKGERSKQGILLFSKLLGKVNVQMEDRLKLPVFHYGAFRGIYKEYLKQFLLKGEENSKLDAKIEKRTNKMRQMMENHAKKLDDPIELHKYVTGQKGNALHLSFDPEEGPNFGSEDVETLEKMFGKMTPEDQKQLREQYGDDWDKLGEGVEEDDDK